MSKENEDVKSTSEKTDSNVMRKVKGYAIGIASLFSSISGLANNPQTQITPKESDPIVQETINDIPEKNNTENTYVIDEDTLDLAQRRVSESSSSKSDFIIGNIKDENLFTIYSSPYSVDRYPDTDFRAGLTRDTYELNSKDEYNKVMEERDGAFAYCNGEEYNIPKYKISGDFKQHVDSLLNTPESRSNLTADVIEQLEYLRGNPVAQALIKTHEFDVHGHHDAQGLFSNSQFSPYMGVVFSDMTEKIAYFSEYVALAQIYSNLKEKGVETYHFEGHQVPLESILDFKQGAKELINKYDGDIQNPNFITDAVILSCQQWDKERSEGYATQALIHANTENGSLIGMIIQARHWDKTTKAMLQGIKIGNQDIHIPNKCLQYFLPSEERVSSILGDDYITNENLLNIDKYLDSIGIKNDDDKSIYLVEQAIKIDRRQNDADLNLRNLFLACGKDNSGTISYTDGICDTIDSNGNVFTSAASAEGFHSTLETLDNAVMNRSVTQQLNDDLSKIIIKTEKQTPEQILANDLSNITVKTEISKTNTNSIGVMNDQFER